MQPISVKIKNRSSNQKKIASIGKMYFTMHSSIAIFQVFLENILISIAARDLCKYIALMKIKEKLRKKDWQFHHTWGLSFHKKNVINIKLPIQMRKNLRKQV